MVTKKINIGLFGFGTVGKGLHDVLSRVQSERVSIQIVCVRHLERHPETYVKMTLIRGANACFRREDHWSSKNDGRFIDRKCRIGYKRSCHAGRRTRVSSAVPYKMHISFTTIVL